jgi:hypothetical protein
LLTRGFNWEVENYYYTFAVTTRLQTADGSSHSEAGFRRGGGTSGTAAAAYFFPPQKVFFFSRSGTTADGSSHSEAGGGAVEAQVQANKRERKQS